MTDFKNGEKLVFSSECGSMDWPCTIKKTGIDWKWQAMDGVITKAPLGGGGKSTGPNPSHRQSNSGTKRSILVDGKGYHLVYL